MKKSNKLIIIGDSDFAQIAYEYFTHDSDYEVVAFAVEPAYLNKDSLFGIPVVSLEDTEKQFPVSDHYAFVAITYPQLNRLRSRLLKVVKDKGYKIASYVSSKASCWPNVKLGENVFIFEDNTVQPFSEIGNNVILWSGNHIGHHSTIGNNCFISSHVVISGHCTIGENCFIGVNATIADNVNIAQDNFIGLGCVINKSTEENMVYTGNPAVASSVAAKRLLKVRE